jgi:hypothetical protein
LQAPTKWSRKTGSSQEEIWQKLLGSLEEDDDDRVVKAEKAGAEVSNADKKDLKRIESSRQIEGQDQQNEQEAEESEDDNYSSDDSETLRPLKFITHNPGNAIAVEDHQNLILDSVILQCINLLVYFLSKLYTCMQWFR